MMERKNVNEGEEGKTRCTARERTALARMLAR
jgi:hypothetical protein